MIKSFLPAFIVLCAFAFNGPVRAAEGWKTDYKAAVAEAKAGNKPILVDFTGSDWCTWCVRLSKDTFSKPEFIKFAKEKLVLLEVDFPRAKPQSDAVKRQNEKLQEKFGVEGFPTLVLVDKNGAELARHSGYLEGGPAAMTAWIEGVVAKQ